jgi:hypothetical protein
VASNGGSTSGTTKYHDAAWITPKGHGIILHPLQRELLVFDAKDWRWRHWGQKTHDA